MAWNLGFTLMFHCLWIYIFSIKIFIFYVVFNKLVQFWSESGQNLGQFWVRSKSSWIFGWFWVWFQLLKHWSTLAIGGLISYATHVVFVLGAQHSLPPHELHPRSLRWYQVVGLSHIFALLFLLLQKLRFFSSIFGHFKDPSTSKGALFLHWKNLCSHPKSDHFSSFNQKKLNVKCIGCQILVNSHENTSAIKVYTS